MTKAQISDWSATASDNTDINDISLAESVMRIPAINNAMREFMAQIAEWTGSDTIASAATTDLGSVAAGYVSVSGTTTITSFGTVRAGTIKAVKFSGALTLTHNATSLILLGGASRTTAAGDVGIYVSEGSGNWREVAYRRGDGQLVATVTSSNAQVKLERTGTSSGSSFLGANDTELLVVSNSSGTRKLAVDTNGKLTTLGGHNTYSPTAVGTTTAGVGTYTTQYGEYLEIGNAVLFAVDMAWTAHTGTGQIEIGLPVTPNNTAAVPFAVTSANLTVTAGKVIGAQINVFTGRIALVETPTGGGSLTAVNMDTAATIRVSGVYFK